MGSAITSANASSGATPNRRARSAKPKPGYAPTLWTSRRRKINKKLDLQMLVLLRERGLL
jgi:hypothetical protein